MAMTTAMKELVLSSIQPTAAELAMDGDYDQLKEVLMSLKEQLDECESEAHESSNGSFGNGGDNDENENDGVEERETAEDTSERAAMEWIIDRYVNAVDENGKSALFYACNQNSTSMALLLLSSPFGADPNLLDADGFPPIYVPCERGFLFVAQLLLKFGADANHQVLLDAEEDPGFYKATNGSSDNVNAGGIGGIDEEHRGVPSVATPLLAAILMQKAKIVKLLLEHGANPNVVTDTIVGKKSALEIATAIVPNTGIRDLLYEHGAMNAVSCRPVSLSMLSAKDRFKQFNAFS